MNRQELLLAGKRHCINLAKQYPDLQALHSIAHQIDYLTGIDNGSISDRSKLKNITIGVLTAREIEPLDDVATEIFYKISVEAKSI